MRKPPPAVAPVLEAEPFCGAKYVNLRFPSAVVFVRVSPPSSTSHSSAAMASGDGARVRYALMDSMSVA